MNFKNENENENEIGNELRFGNENEAGNEPKNERGNEPSIEVSYGGQKKLERKICLPKEIMKNLSNDV